MSRPASFPVTIIASILALIFLSFGCGVGVAIWISRQDHTMWPVILLIAVLLFGFAGLARLIWSRYA
jgi:ABC-type polysaccharide/polyol phosphate export permease